MFTWKIRSVFDKYLKKKKIKSIKMEKLTGKKAILQNELED